MSDIECLTKQPVMLRRRDDDGAKEAFRISVTVSVEDVGELWAAAAAKALALPGMTLDDVLDVPGPREDPEVAECLSMLTAPARVPGCKLQDFTVEYLAAAEPARRPRARLSSIPSLVGRLEPASASRPIRTPSFGIYRVGAADHRTPRPAKSRLN